jgi:glyoxylase-like metal-dependent hydrolase (beta-lactamase superfamily II)
MQIAAGVHSIGPRSAGYSKGGYSHAYLVEDPGTHELTLVDTGWDTDARDILAYLWRIQRAPNEIAHIALTHAHRSHLGGLAMLKRLSRASVWAHETEIPIIDGRQKAHPVTLTAEPPSLIPFRLGALLGIPKSVPCIVDEKLEEGTRLGPLVALHTPGHTPGHVCFHQPAEHALIAGDAIATWPRFGPGWPKFNLDEQLYLRSLDRLIDLEPLVVGPGHGDPLVERTAARLATLRGTRTPA